MLRVSIDGSLFPRLGFPGKEHYGPHISPKHESERESAARRTTFSDPRDRSLHQAPPPMGILFPGKESGLEVARVWVCSQSRF